MRHLISVNKQPTEPEIDSLKKLLKIAEAHNLEDIVTHALQSNALSRKYLNQYLTFMCLSVLTDKPLAVQSRTVDQIWDTHIRFTLKYYEFCDSLGKFIHRTPIINQKAKLDKVQAVKNLIETSIYYFGRDVFEVPEKDNFQLFMSFVNR